MKRFVLIGAGGFGREVASIMEYVNEFREFTYDLLGFVDDGDQFTEGMMINGYPILGKTDWILEHKDEDFYCNCTIGNPHTKAKIQRELMAQGVRFGNVYAFDAFVNPHTKVGKGCVFYGNAIVSVNCTIGDGVLCNQGVDIGHDAVIGDYTTIMPYSGISGYCKIGSEVNIGGHAFIVPGKKVGDNATIAAGSIVFSNVKAGTTVLGNPAKRMRELE